MELDIDNPYMKGERFSDSAKFDESAEACMKIIQMDKNRKRRGMNWENTTTDSKNARNPYPTMMIISDCSLTLQRQGKAMTLQRNADYVLATKLSITEENQIHGITFSKIPDLGILL